MELFPVRTQERVTNSEWYAVVSLMFIRGLDIALTAVAIKYGATEINPIYGSPTPSVMRMVLVNAPFFAFLLAIPWTKHDFGRALWIAFGIAALPCGWHVYNLLGF